MKKIILLLFAIAMQANLFAQEYFSEGTKWTEIRLDTLKYDSWYSKVDGEWVPNYETIEYYVQGEYADRHGEIYNCIYTNGPEWSDSLTLMISQNLNDNSVYAAVPVFHEDNWGSYLYAPGTAYQFDWYIDKVLYSREVFASNSTCFPPEGMCYYGIIKEIKEGDFGGVRSLKYVDLEGGVLINVEDKTEVEDNTEDLWMIISSKGGRIIQGIGITEWNDGECLFGPIKPYEAFYFLRETSPEEERHYRSMLVHFERDGEVLYDVWPEKEATIAEPVTYTAGQMATIIMPTAPDAGKGKYYRLDRVEGSEIVFEQELQPRAHVPYIIVPSEDFSIDPCSLDLEGLTKDSVSIEGVSFIGSYTSKELPALTGGDGGGSLYYDIIDKTPDCSVSPFGETGKGAIIGALRAYLLVHWEDPYHHGGTKVPGEKMEIALKDDPNGIKTLSNSPLKGEDIYDLSGRKMANGKLPSGVYLKSRRKILIK